MQKVNNKCSLTTHDFGVSPLCISTTISFSSTMVGPNFTVELDLYKGRHMGQSTAGDMIATNFLEKTHSNKKEKQGAV